MLHMSLGMDAKERFNTLKKKFPEKFAQRPVVEDAAFLAKVGIVIPGKDTFPQGVVKAFATDFIVEEVGLDESIATVAYSPMNSGAIPGEPGGTHFATLVKTGITTFEAVKQVEHMLGCKPDSVRYAGIKDVQAVTAQRISIRGAKPEAFKNVSHPHFFLKDIGAGKGAIATGGLKGNRFTILVRTPQQSLNEQKLTELRDRLTYVGEHGFYNFFYLQRFSTPRYINHAWGRDIIAGNYESAVKSILCETTPTELPLFSEMRDWFSEHYNSWSEICSFIDETLPEQLYVERAIVNHLEQNPRDFVGALGTHEKQVMMWVYAYASKLFNELISEHLVGNRALPDTLPLLISHEREDTAVYRRMLERDNVFPPRWVNLRPFPSIRTNHREVRTKSPVTLHDIDVVNEGVRFTFTLGKGEYATTFLAHLFNLVGGINRETDTEFSWNETSLIDPNTRSYFEPVLAHDVDSAENE